MNELHLSIMETVRDRNNYLPFFRRLRDSNKELIKNTIHVIAKDLKDYFIIFYYFAEIRPNWFHDKSKTSKTHTSVHDTYYQLLKIVFADNCDNFWHIHVHKWKFYLAHWPRNLREQYWVTLIQKDAIHYVNGSNWCIFIFFNLQC